MSDRQTVRTFRLSVYRAFLSASQLKAHCRNLASTSLAPPCRLGKDRALRGSAVACPRRRRGTHWPLSSVPRDPTVSRNLSDLASVPTEPIPLSVLTGFLGSGKTTFLSRVLAAPDLRDTAVIVSEFGVIALDHLLLEAAVDDVLELPNGCT